MLLLTAKVSLDNRLEGLELGADDYLAKPFRVAELVLRVRNQLALKQRLREQLRAELNQPLEKETDEAGPENSDSFMLEFYNLMEQNLDDPSFGVEQMIRSLDMSRTTFYRRVGFQTPSYFAKVFREKYQVTPTDFIRR